MERGSKNGSIANELLSQSYSEGVERIIGTQKDFSSSLNVPVKVVEKRKKYWDGFFDKYSKELSDDVELHIEELELKRGRDKSQSVDYRMPMRKSRYLVQYWIDTGNPPCKALLDENECSESGSSLSEKEFFNSPTSSVDKKINSAQDEKDRFNVESSCSSVDTAAYILSNTNVTKKADTIAIVEGAKQLDTFKPENFRHLTSAREVDNSLAGNKTSDASNGKVVVDNNGNKFVNSSQENSSSSIMGNMIQRASTEPVKNISRVHTLKDIDTIPQSNNVNESANIDLSPVLCNRVPICKEPVENELICSSNKDDSNAFENGHESADENSSSNKDEIFSSTADLVARDSTMKTIHRKKLYSGRDSPVDLILMKSTSGNRISQSRKSLHPALDSVLTAKWRLLKKRKSFGRKKKKRSSFIHRSFESYDNSVSSASNGTEDEQTEDSCSQLHFKPKKMSPKSSEMMKKLQEYTSLRKCYVSNSLEEDKSPDKPDANLNNAVKDKTVENEVPETTEKKSPSFNLNPEIHLERIAESDIIKNKKSYGGPINPSDKTLRISLTRMSDQDVQHYKVPKSIRAETTSLSRKISELHTDESNSTISLDDRGYSSKRSKSANTSKSLRQLYSSTYQRIDSEDVDSSETTVLICECKNSMSHEFCTLTDNEFTANSGQNLLFSPTESDCYSSNVFGRKTSNASYQLNSSFGSMKLRERLNRSLSDVSSQESVKSSTGAAKKKLVRKLRGTKETKISNDIQHRNPIVLLRRLSPEDFGKKDLNISKSNSKARKNSPQNLQNVTDKVHTLRSRANTNSAELNAFTNTVEQSVADNSELIFTRSRGTNIRIHEKKTGNHLSNILLSSDDEDDFLKLIEHSHPKKRIKLRSDAVTLDENSDSIFTVKDKSRTLNTAATVVVNNKYGLLDRKTRHVPAAIRNTRASCFVLQSSSEDERSLGSPSSKKSKDGETANNNKNKKYVSAQMIKNTHGNAKRLDIMSNRSENKHENLTCTIRTRSCSSSSETQSSFNDPVRKTHSAASSQVESKANTDTSSRKPQTRLHRMRFQTRLFDSDSESASLSSNMSCTSERN